MRAVYLISWPGATLDRLATMVTETSDVEPVAATGWTAPTESRGSNPSTPKMRRRRIDSIDGPSLAPLRLRSVPYRRTDGAAARYRVPHPHLREWDASLLGRAVSRLGRAPRRGRLRGAAGSSGRGAGRRRS